MKFSINILSFRRKIKPLFDFLSRKNRESDFHRKRRKKRRLRDQTENRLEQL